MNISEGYTRFRGKIMPVLEAKEIKRKEAESRTPGRQIKKEICDHTGLPPAQVKVRWGRGNSHLHLDILLHPDAARKVGNKVVELVMTSPQWGWESWESDYSLPDETL